MIELHLNHKSGVSLYQQLVQQITSAILTDRLPAGAQLPSVRELARSADVNALTVVKAYSTLEQQKLIETRWGKGSFVAAAAPAQRSRSSEAHLEMLVGRFLAEALPLSPTPQHLLELVRKSLNGELQGDGA